MGIRRVVTGTNAEGRSYVVSDSDAPLPAASSLAPGTPAEREAFAEIWMTRPDRPLGGEVDQSSYFPPPGATYFRIGALPAQASPWHRTPTVDYELILEGEVRLDTRRWRRHPEGGRHHCSGRMQSPLDSGRG